MTRVTTVSFDPGALWPSARNWWLGGPNPSNANNVRNVNTSGALNNNNASNSYGVVPRL